MKGKLQFVDIRPFSHLLETDHILFRQINSVMQYYIIRHIGDKDMNLINIDTKENTNVSINTNLYQMMGILTKTHKDGIVKTTVETRIYPIILTEILYAKSLFKSAFGVETVEFSVKNVSQEFDGKYNNGYIHISDTKIIHKDLFDTAVRFKWKNPLECMDLHEESDIPVGTRLMVEIEITNPKGFNAITNEIVENIVKNVNFKDSGFKFISFSRFSFKEMNIDKLNILNAKLAELGNEIDNIMNQ